MGAGELAICDTRMVAKPDEAFRKRICRCLGIVRADPVFSAATLALVAMLVVMPGHEVVQRQYKKF
jgi:hypothetical protein